MDSIGRCVCVCALISKIRSARSLFLLKINCLYNIISLRVCVAVVRWPSRKTWNDSAGVLCACAETEFHRWSFNSWSMRESHRRLSIVPRETL